MSDSRSNAVLGKRRDHRVYVWREYGTVAHLTESRYLSIPMWTACGRPIPRTWRARVEGVLRPLCARCARQPDSKGK